MDFYQQTAETVRHLNKTERNIFDYVVKNMEQVKNMSIRELAEVQFLSPTTIFRFTQKLGFSGYSDFANSLLITSHNKRETAIPRAVTGGNYREPYLKNILEAARVMSPQQIEKIVALLGEKPNIYILTDDNTHTIGQYCERLFISLDFHAYFPETAYQKRNLVNRIGNEDMIIALSFSGQDVLMIDLIERVFLTARPHLLSITRADNNPLEGLSDTNFYIFAHEMQIAGMDLTSSVPMLMVLELLVYAFLNRGETPSGGG